MLQDRIKSNRAHTKNNISVSRQKRCLSNQHLFLKSSELKMVLQAKYDFKIGEHL